MQLYKQSYVQLLGLNTNSTRLLCQYSFVPGTLLLDTSKHKHSCWDVPGHLSLQFCFSALLKAGSGASGLGGCQAGTGTQEGNDKASSACRPQTPTRKREDPDGQCSPTPNTVQRPSHPQYLHVWRYEGSVCRPQRARHGECTDGDRT